MQAGSEGGKGKEKRNPDGGPANSRLKKISSPRLAAAIFSFVF
jgi:hypothetical protein